MSQFTAQQSINGLQTFSLFTAPADGDYFVNGQLQLPRAEGSGNSQVVAEIDVNSSPVYTGDPGATGFQAVLTLAADDVVEVTLSSSEDVDNVLNAVTGVVGCGVAV